MKYNISGFFQPALIEYGLDGTDAYILDWFVYFTVSGKMYKEIIDEKTFHWCKYQAVIDDIPCIGINNKESMARRFNKYIACGLMEKYVKKTLRGTFTMFYINPDKLNYLTSSTIQSSAVDSKVDIDIDSKVDTRLDSKVDPNNPSISGNHLINNPSSNNKGDDESSRFLINEDIGQKLWKGKETDIRDEKTKNDVSKTQSPRVDYKDDRIEKAFKRFKDYKKDEFKFKYKSHISEQTAVNNLIELCCGNYDNAEKIVNKSIANGWQGLFAIGDNKYSGKQPQKEYQGTYEERLEQQAQDLMKQMENKKERNIIAEVVK